MKKSVLKSALGGMIVVVFIATLSLFLPKTSVAVDVSNGYRPTVKICPDGSRVTRCVQWGWNCNPTWQDLCNEL